MRSRTGLKLGTPIALMAIGLLSVSCGGSPAGLPPVKIGALVPVTGLGLTYYPAAYRAATRAINAHGGIRPRSSTRRGSRRSGTSR